MHWTSLVLTASLAGVGEGPLPSTAAGEPPPALPWNARTVEHLYNRAAFGARSEEIAEGLRIGPEALVERLLAADVEWAEIEPVLFRWEDMGFSHRQLPIPTTFHLLPDEEQVRMCKDNRAVDRLQFFEVADRWLRLCYGNRAPARDRMTLFWHSLFTTSAEFNKRKFEIVRQFQWIRRSALSSYAELLHGIVRDPAMLQYYDNTGNYKEHPNENFARELMELYSLGEGHYSELDVREAARALTGYAGSSAGEFELLAARHDAGEKSILGRTGDFDGDELVEILLAQPACSRYVAARLIRSFEGLDPAPARLEEYAAFLRESGWRIEPFLRRLFLDPAFYREEVLGARVSGPIEFFAAVCHKLEHEPPIAFAHEATKAMGQALYTPPSVKGWPEGMGWMVSDALLRRGNCVAILLGALEPREALEAASSGASAAVEGTAEGEEVGAGMAEEGMEPRAWGLEEYDRLRAHIEGGWWRPRERLLPELASLGARSDAALVEHVLEQWLAIPPPAELGEVLRLYLAHERHALGVSEGDLLDRPAEFDAVLRRMAQVVFSLPEAQLL